MGGVNTSEGPDTSNPVNLSEEVSCNANTTVEFLI